MKQRNIILSMIVLLSSVFIIGCGKDDTHPEDAEKYELEKTKIQFFKNGKMYNETWLPETTSKILIQFKEDNVIEYTRTLLDSGEVEQAQGSFDAEEKTICLKGDCTPYHFEDNYLVRFTYDSSEDGDGTKIYAYYIKK